MRVLLTGGTGFLGSHVAERLMQEGHEVVANVREGSDASFLEKLGARVARASLETGEGLEKALDGVEGVVHCAGGGQVKSFEYETFRKQNVVTTEVLLTAVKRYAPKVRRFVHASSITAAPGAKPREGVEGNDGDPKPNSLYGRSKREAEDVVLRESMQLPVTLLRLPALYGPRDTRWLTAYKAAKFRVLPVLSKTARMSLLFATDAASAMVTPLFVEHPSGAIYSPEDGTPRTQEELGRIIAEAVGVQAVAAPIPSGLLFGVARVNEWVGEKMGAKVFLTQDKVRDMLSDQWACDATPMRNELHWSAKVSLPEGAKQTAAWFRSEGLL